MPAIVRTFTTRIDSHPALTARAELESRVERKLHAALQAGREFKGDLAISFYQQFGISAKTLDGIYRQLKARLKSISDLAKVHDAELEARIAARRKRVADVAKELLRLRRSGKVGPHGIRHSLHQHKRRLVVLERKQAKVKEQIRNPSVCFGTRKLFNAQHHLAAAGFEDHKDWRRSWHAARRAQFFIEGAARSEAGNQFARLTARADGTFDLELRLPETLGYLAEHETTPSGHVVRSIHFGAVRFAHGGAEIREALTSQRPLSYRFRRDDDGSWFVSVMLRQDFADPSVADFSGGCLGVDLNADHVALTLVDATGNPLTTVKDAPGRPVMTRRIDLPTYGKTRAQRLDMIRKAASEIVTMAERLGVPVAAEKLDFRRKRAELENTAGKKRARMLTSFVHAAFGEALARACVRRSVKLVLVNPAYTSLIGRVKFAPRYGSSVHAAAALAIARRAMALSERLPASGEGIPVLLASGDRVTLPRPARIARRQVWSSWSRLSAGLSAVHAGRRGARRGARSDGARGRKTSGAAATGSGSRRPFSGPG